MKITSYKKINLKTIPKNTITNIRQSTYHHPNRTKKNKNAEGEI